MNTKPPPMTVEERDKILDSLPTEKEIFEDARKYYALRLAVTEAAADLMATGVEMVDAREVSRHLLDMRDTVERKFEEK